MVTSISLRRRNAAIIWRARQMVARVNAEAQLQQSVKTAAARALRALQEVYTLEEKLNRNLMSEIAEIRWRARRKAIEKELQRIMNGHLP